MGVKWHATLNSCFLLEENDCHLMLACVALILLKKSGLEETKKLFQSLDVRHLTVRACHQN